jgi:hypothetical protein
MVGLTVAGIALLHRTVDAVGGAMNRAEQEWVFDAWAECDARDPLLVQRVFHMRLC